MIDWDKEMQMALEADGEKLLAMTGEDHGPFDDPMVTEPFDQIISYRGYTIRYDPPPIPDRRWDWQFQHDQFDGAEDASDHRYGQAASPVDCIYAIDEIEDDGKA